MPFLQISNNLMSSFHHCTVTTLTIGFGDFVPGNNQETLDDVGNWEYVYLAGVFIWIVFGLGYIFMIISIIADGLKQPAKKAFKKFEPSFAI